MPPRDPIRPMPAFPRAAARALAAAAALLGLATVLARVPPPTRGLLPLVVLASETAPLVGLLALLLFGAVLLLLPTHRATPFVAAAALLAAGLDFWPFLELRRAAAAADAQIAALASGLAGAPRSLAGSSPAPAEAGVRSGGSAVAPAASIRHAGLDRAAVPGYDLRRALTGLPTPRRVTERRVRYAAADGAPLELRVFRAPGGAPRPTIVALYAGAWSGGDASQQAAVHRYLAGRGYTVVAADYRHAPAYRFPAQLDDVRRALALVRDSAAAWGVDTARIALLGRSSGGHLALLGAYAPGGPPVRAVVALYAPTDLAAGYADVPSPDPIDVRRVLVRFLGAPPARARERYREASPISYARSGLPPTLLLYGGRDHVVKPRFGRELAAALRRAGDPVVYVGLPWAEHGFDFLPAGLGGQLALGVIERFLARVL